MLTTEEVARIAELARIELSPEEQERLRTTISAVLDYMKILNEVDTDAVEPTFQVTGLTGVLRADEPVPSSEELRQKLLACMPKLEAGELVVPTVFTDAP
jgi:aspartyl-tRNA(Asn)/glutamyl-tRNA(Gln) amidotransferase subunit C